MCFFSLPSISPTPLQSSPLSSHRKARLKVNALSYKFQYFLDRLGRFITDKTLTNFVFMSIMEMLWKSFNIFPSFMRDVVMSVNIHWTASNAFFRDALSASRWSNLKKSSHVPSSLISPFLYRSSNSSIEKIPYFFAILNISDSHRLNLICRYVFRLSFSNFSWFMFRIEEIFVSVVMVFTLQRSFFRLE